MTGHQRTVGSRGTAPTGGTPEAQGWQAPHRRPRRSHRYPVRAQDRHPWEMLPKEIGCGSGMTCWQRLKEWYEVEVWDHLHEALLDRLGEADHIDWSRASSNSATVPTPGRPCMLEY